MGKEQYSSETVHRRFRPYPKYKDSGIEWLGEIPVHWEIKRLKRLFLVVNGSTPQSGVAAYWNGDIPWATPEDLGELQGSVIQNTRRYITEAGYRSCGTTLVPAGSLVLSTRAPIGHLAIGGLELCTNQGCRSLVFRRELSHKFFHFELLAARSELESWGQGSTFKELAKSKLEDMHIVEPPETEQRAIAVFLDRETEKIDALIAKKERLIELLQKKRTALITQAVTKGRDPNVPMKDSGVEWLGEIPAHWEVLRLKHLLKARKGAIKTGPFGSQLQSFEMLAGEIKVYNQRSVLDRDFSVGENYISLHKFAELRSFEAYPGDLLITTRGTIGKCAVLPAKSERGILHPCLMRVQVDQVRALNRYLEILIQDSGIVLKQLQLMSNATTIDVIYSDSLKEVWNAIPPFREQGEIADFLDIETAKIDDLVAKIQGAIDRLHEYRTAFISAAVTGKIDVRHHVAFENNYSC
jgi:type I restriction enzyme S subunit